MALDPQYMISPNLQEYFVDKNTGLPLSGGQVYYYSDINRSTLKNVYTISGVAPNYSYIQLPNPLTLSAVGTPQYLGADIRVYYYPFDDEGDAENYYIEVYAAGEMPPATPQFTREAWPNFIEDQPADDATLLIIFRMDNFLHITIFLAMY